MRLGKGKYVLRVLLVLFSSAFLVVVQEFVSSDSQIPLRAALVALACLAIIVIATFSGVCDWRRDCTEAEESEVRQRNERAQKVLSGITQLADVKADCFRENSYDLTITDKEWPFFYGIHQYTRRICENLERTVADVIRQEVEYVDVSLIYLYVDEGKWKWLAGKSAMSEARRLEDLVEDGSSLYGHVLRNKDKAPFFCNDKTTSKNYLPGRRDELFGRKSSFFAMPITFSNNQEALVEAILVISTYGVSFIPPESGKEEIEKFKREFTYKVIPYYVSIIQTELGALYLRHNWEKARLARGSWGEGKSSEGRIPC